MSFRASPGQGCQAFSLLEVVAVLAIVGILAAVTFPRLVQQLDTAAGLKGDAFLEVLADGFQKGVARSRYLPTTAPDDWAGLISSNTGWQLTEIENNAFSKNSRVLLADPGCTVGLPYVQTSTGTASMISPRFLLVSSMSVPLPSLSKSDFGTLWNNAENTIPSGPQWDSWKAQGANETDLKIKRIDLSSSFVRLSLVNLNPSGGRKKRSSRSTSGSYIVDGTAATLRPGATASGFFFAGTLLTLQTPSNAVIQILNRDSSLALTNGTWCAQ